MTMKDILRIKRTMGVKFCIKILLTEIWFYLKTNLKIHILIQQSEMEINLDENSKVVRFLFHNIA